MTEIGLNHEAFPRVPAKGHDGQMGCALIAAAGPSLVTLESGIQALVKIAGFAYVDGKPLAIGAQLDEHVDPGHWVKPSADGMNLELVQGAVRLGVVRPGKVDRLPG